MLFDRGVPANKCEQIREVIQEVKKANGRSPFQYRRSTQAAIHASEAPDILRQAPGTVKHFVVSSTCAWCDNLSRTGKNLGAEAPGFIDIKPPTA